jgi:DNA repair protein RecN (Recombination protein N)
LEDLHNEQLEFEKELPDAAEVSRLELILEDIDQVDPAPGEDEEITAKFNLASNSRQVLENSGIMINALTDGENSLADQLGTIYRKLLELSKSDEKSIAPMLELCDSIQESVSTLSADISAMADKVDLDAEALAALESRLSSLYTLKRRYGPTLEQVLEQKADAENRIRLHKESQARRDAFAAQEKELQAQLVSKAKELSACRQAKAKELTKQVQEKARTIGLEKCTVSAAFSPIQPGANGCDHLEFYFSANAGEEPMPLRRIASSGELSRLMLALKTVLADADAVPVVVFDEIDANIGGETATRVGRELRALGQKRQVLCISHQALVAAQADSHFCVEKYSDAERTTSFSRLLTSVERPAELGRMLGGGDSALTHAKAILKDLMQKAEK